MPTVSVVVPTYNRADVLPRAIESVLAQTLEDFELIVVDDASPDPTRDTVEGYDDSRVRYVRHDRNRGANWARNTGIEHSEGEYIAFLDDDDAWEPSKLATQIETFHTRGEDYGLVYSGRRIVEDGVVIAETHPTREGRLYRELLRENFVPSETPVVRRTCFDEVGVFDTDLESGQDWDMWLRIAQRYRIGVVSEVLATTYRESVNRISDDPRRVYQGRSRILEKYADDLRDDPVAFGRLHYQLGAARLSMGDPLSSYHLRRSFASNPRDFRALALFLVSLFPFRKDLFERIQQVV